MRFEGRLRDETFTEPALFAAAVKAQPPLEPFSRAGKPVKVQLAKLPPKRPTPLRNVVLTTEEREWLGANVTANGLAGVWQVWSLGPYRGDVWIVRDSEFRGASTSRLTRV